MEADGDSLSKNIVLISKDDDSLSIVTDSNFDPSKKHSKSNLYLMRITK